MTLIIRIKTANAAFGETPDDRLSEVARILRRLADDLESTTDGWPRKLYDVNGNQVGTVSGL